MAYVVNLSNVLIPSFNIPGASCFLVCQLPWDQTENYIRSGHRNSEDFDPETLKTIALSEEEGIKAIIAKPWNKQSTKVVSYLFSKEKDWTTEKAQEWFREHEKKANESFSWTVLEKKVLTTCHSLATRTRFDNRLRYLLKKEYIERVSRGVYRVTEKGIKYMQVI